MQAFPVSRRGLRGAATVEKSTEGPGEVQQEETPRHFPGQSTAGQGSRAEVLGSPETVGPEKESKVEGNIGPWQGLLRTGRALPQRPECSQC